MPLPPRIGRFSVLLLFDAFSLLIAIVNCSLILETHRVGTSMADGVATAVVLFVAIPLLLIHLLLLWKNEFPWTGLVPFVGAVVTTIARIIQIRN